jgi:hypothetical protein
MSDHIKKIMQLLTHGFIKQKSYKCFSCDVWMDQQKSYKCFSRDVNGPTKTLQVFFLWRVKGPRNGCRLV